MCFNFLMKKKIVEKNNNSRFKFFSDEEIKEIESRNMKKSRRDAIIII